MKDLVLITCYLGKFPTYIGMFLDSCAWNPNIDFLIITDNVVNMEIIPSNVTVINMDINDIRSLIHRRVSENAELLRAYKLCDYKPAYGILFSEYISHYKYWGHCDIDLIWGDLENFVLPLLTKGFDRYFKYGHLTLYRNDQEISNYFRKDYSGLNYKVVYSTNISCAFDEENGSWTLGKENGLKQYDDTICFDIKRIKRQNNLDIYAFVNFLKQCFIIEKGHIYRYYEENQQILKEEKAYIHFQKRTMAGIALCKNRSYQLLSDRVIELDSKFSIEDCFERNTDIKISLIKLFQSRLKRLNQSIKYNMLKLRHGILPEFCKKKKN